MSNWVFFQLVVDIALFALVVFYIMREGETSDLEESGDDGQRTDEKVDTHQLESLMDELARLVIRAEKVAERIEKASGATNPADSGAGRKPAEPSQPPGGESGVGPDPGSESYERAVRLIKKGLPDEEISGKIGLPAHEISLIRNLAT